VEDETIEVGVLSPALSLATCRRSRHVKHS
jgi:hypothetical protein